MMIGGVVRFESRNSRIAMKNVRRIAYVLGFAATAVASSTSAQTPRYGGEDAHRPVLDARLSPSVPVDPGDSHGTRLDSAFTSVGMTAARGRRPWWLIPLVSAGAGAVLFEAVRGDECEQTDCMIYVPPPVQGAVLGLVAGTIVEIVLRVSDR